VSLLALSTINIHIESYIKVIVRSMSLGLIESRKRMFTLPTGTVPSVQHSDEYRTISTTKAQQPAARTVSGSA